MLPALAIYALFVLYPLGHAAWMSLFAWDGLLPPVWVGLDNYREIFEDPALRGAFMHSLVLIAFYSVLPVTIGLVLAAALSRRRVRGLTAFRTLLFLPQVVAMVVVAVIWRWMYSPAAGPVNQVLGALQLDSFKKAWLGDFTWALPAVGLIGTWVMFGLCLVLFLSGVQKIDRSLYEAARIDGAGAVREFFAVTLPGLRNELSVALTLTTIAALRTFDLIYITTQGGPGDSTSVPSFEVYHRAFESGQIGSAAAIGITLTVIIFILSVGITRIAEMRS